MRKLTSLLLLTVFVVITLPVQAQKFNVISFNIRYNPYYQSDGDNCWNNRRSAVVKMIRDQQPDAIGLQEALIDQLEYLDRNLSDYRRVGVGRDNGLSDGEFMAIYYNINRLELVWHTTRWLSETPRTPSLGWDAACRRTVTIARFRDRESSKEFIYLNTHLDHVGQKARAESTHQIAAMVDSLSSAGIPIIVGGDMNSTIDDTIFRDFYRCGLKDARKMSLRSSNDITYNAFGKNGAAVIDHFFVRDLKVRRFRTLNTDYGVPYISDHYPIAIRFRVK